MTWHSFEKHAQKYVLSCFSQRPVNVIEGSGLVMGRLDFKSLFSHKVQRVMLNKTYYLDPTGFTELLCSRSMQSGHSGETKSHQTQTNTGTQQVNKVLSFAFPHYPFFPSKASELSSTSLL